VADFYCAELKLVLELDGAVHDTPPQREYDRVRTAVFERYGLRVVRLKNHEVTEPRLRSLILSLSSPAPTVWERGQG
jgi:very-short-patch-repair endonuclease